jgi:hypothetical protein
MLPLPAHKKQKQDPKLAVQNTCPPPCTFLLLACPGQGHASLILPRPGPVGEENVSSLQNMSIIGHCRLRGKKSGSIRSSCEVRTYTHTCIVYKHVCTGGFMGGPSARRLRCVHRDRCMYVFTAASKTSGEADGHIRMYTYVHHTLARALDWSRSKLLRASRCTTQSSLPTPTRTPSALAPLPLSPTSSSPPPPA